MHPGNVRRYQAALFLVLLLTGCVGTAPPPTQPVQAPLSSPTAIPSLHNTEPTPTAGAFEFKPTFTPRPTDTPFVIDDFLPEEGYGPKNYPPGINPLTGLEIDNPALLERRPMVIKVTNFPRRVRPQWGLTLADHVYEYYLEDGMTRFVGIFYGQDAERVGPIRSARPFDEHLVRMYKGIFAFGYADRKVYDPLMEMDFYRYLVLQRPDNCPPMCRIGPESDYNTLYTNTAELNQYITDKGLENGRQNLDGLRFRVQPANGRGEVNHVLIRFTRTSHHMWQYEPATSRYVRSQEAESRDLGAEVYEPLFDSLTGERIAADNLIILLVPSEQYFKSNSTDIYNFNLIGAGNAYALRDGRAYKIIWRRPASDSLISLAFENGNSYPLKPGNTWFEVLTATSAYQVESTGVWRFIFDLGLE
jgi:hypothetical protein